MDGERFNHSAKKRVMRVYIYGPSLYIQSNQMNSESAGLNKLPVNFMNLQNVQKNFHYKVPYPRNVSGSTGSGTGPIQLRKTIG